VPPAPVAELPPAEVVPPEPLDPPEAIPPDAVVPPDDVVPPDEVVPPPDVTPPEEDGLVDPPPLDPAALGFVSMRLQLGTQITNPAARNNVVVATAPNRILYS